MLKLDVMEENEMITISIDEEKMRDMMKEILDRTIKDVLKDSSLEYWVRSEVHKVLAKELYEKVIKEKLTEEFINKMLKEAFDNYITDLMDKRPN